MEKNLFYNAKEPNLENKVSLYKITKDKRMKYLDDFLNNYEWVVLWNNKNVKSTCDLKYYGYSIYDLQLGLYVETNALLKELINRVVCRALDYEIDEHYENFFKDFDIYNHKGYIDYINTLYDIAKDYKLTSYQEIWLKEIGKSIREMTSFFKDVNK